MRIRHDILRRVAVRPACGRESPVAHTGGTMPGTKSVLVSMNTSELLAGDVIRGMVSYQERHPHLRLEVCQTGTHVPHPGLALRQNIDLVQADGVVANVFWQATRSSIPPGIPIVNVDDSRRPTFLPTVFMDQARMGELAAEHLLAQELPHYAFISAVGRGYGAHLRWRGFRDRLAQAGQDCFLFDKAFPKTAQQLREADLLAWVASLPKPVGIHTVYLHLALRLLWACRQLGVRVPTEVALIGGQDFPIVSNAWVPTVSDITTSCTAMGYEALALLDRLLRGEKPPAAPVLITDVAVVPRQSSDLRGMRDPEVAHIRRLIAEQAHRPLVIKELLSHTPLSRRALERRFEHQIGHTLHDEMVRVRMGVAERLLRQTLLRPAQIARQSGYASYRVFAVAFRKHTGMTASEFRQLHVSEAGAHGPIHH